jgi:large subunit ribosomal protein L9e
MKELTKSETLVIPEGVEITIKARFITVTGPRGTLTKNLRHINCEVQRVSKNKISVVVYHGARKHVACIRTAVAHIRNMITGVTKVNYLVKNYLITY